MSIADSYDAIPYESTPLPDTHPGNLFCLARLYGVNPAPPGQCSVLELGCASGGNLIPMAARLPHSQFLGIEISAEQAQEGQERIAELGLANCEIRREDILDFKDEGTRFDYIITHGVYSWSPPEVRTRILELSSQLLSPRGVAYISYNTYPGWRMRGMLRDMLLYQVSDIASPRAKLETAQNYLQMLETVLEESDEIHAAYLKQEIARIQDAHPSYLYHEYLENFNEPVLLRDFIHAADQHGLDYLCDVALAMQIPAFLGERAAQILGSIEDRLERLQQADFLLNRNFHRSLLCHKAQHPAREPDLDQLRGLAWIADLHPQRDLDLDRVEQAPFSHGNGNTYEIFHPLTKVALTLLAEDFPASVPFGDLLSQARRRLQDCGSGALAGQDGEMLNEMFSLYANGIIHARPIDLAGADASLADWQMDAVARQGILRGDSHIPTIHHASVHLDPFAARAIRYLDGRTDEDGLLSKLVADFKPGGDLQGLVEPGMSDEQLTSHLSLHLGHLLTLFRKHGVLG